MTLCRQRKSLTLNLLITIKQEIGSTVRDFLQEKKRKKDLII
jgi:hypothetical protein